MTWPQVQQIPTAAVRVDGERLRPLRPELVDTLAASIAKDGLKVPIIVRYGDGNERHLVAGLHRLEAAKRLGWPMIEASIDPDMDEAQGKRVEIIENLHRGELTKTEREQHVAELLRLDPAKSDRQHAKTANVSPTTVGKVRKRLEGAGQLSTVDSRIGGDGKARKQPAHKAGRQGDPVSEPVDRSAPIPDTAPEHDALALARAREMVAEILCGGPALLPHVEELVAGLSPKDRLKLLKNTVHQLPTGELFRFGRWFKEESDPEPDYAARKGLPSAIVAGDAAPEPVQNTAPACTAPTGCRYGGCKGVGRCLYSPKDSTVPVRPDPRAAA